MSVLDSIANPRLADIGKALDLREQRIMRDEQRRKEIRMGQLIAEAIPNLREGTPMYEMATTDPERFALLAKVTGTPLNKGEEMQQFADDVKTMNMLMQADPDQAYTYAKETAAQRSQQGIGAPMLEKWVQAYETDPIAATTSAIMMNREINGEEIRKQEMEGRKMDQQDRVLDIQEQRLNQQGQDGATPYYTPIQTAEGTFAFDARTGKMAPAIDEKGGMVVAAGADPELQGRLAKAKTSGSGEATREIETKKAISRSDQLMGAIQEARELIPKATGSYAGAARDSLGRAVGIATDKSKVSAQLETLSGWMVSNVPRMEGPQSNFDVDNYKTMAAKVGDRTVPIEERLAALDTLEKLQTKYRDINSEIIGGEKSEQEAPALSGQDKQAYGWAKANPNDPRAAAILQKLGVR